MVVAANILWRQQKYDEALKQAQTAADIAENAQDWRRATDLIERLTRARGGGEEPLPR